MEPRTGAQDVLRCHLCETLGPPMYCDICDIYLCKACVIEHLSDLSKKHFVVPYNKRESTNYYPKCLKHLTKQCELYCEECDIPICSHCISTWEHRLHKRVDISNNIENKKTIIQKDLQELEKTIYPKYQEIASKIPVQKDDLNKNYQKLTTDINKYGEDYHREIDKNIQKLNSELNEINSKHLSLLNKHENEVAFIISKIEQSIADLKKLLDSSDVRPVSSYKSKIAEFRRPPSSITVALPCFTLQKQYKENIYQQFGSLSTLSINVEEHESTINYRTVESFPLTRPLIDEPHIIQNIDTDQKELRVACLTDDDIWTCGNQNLMKLYNLEGKLVKSIQTKSGNTPKDITVTRSGDLVYTDYEDKTVNIVKNTQIQTMIRLQGWRPHGVCSTSSGDLLVVMDCDGHKQTKVVRYSGSTEKQIIQFNDKGKPFYSHAQFEITNYLFACDHRKCICENKNLDICVSDNIARVLVVVNQAGKLRFLYTGLQSIKRNFYPYGITTDSQSRILTADCMNRQIHILDQDGQFLRYINVHLHDPYGLCVDPRDNLFVTERFNGKVKKLQYCMKLIYKCTSV